MRRDAAAQKGTNKTPPAQLMAIAHVYLEAPLAAAAALRAFYTEIIGLELVEPAAPSPASNGSAGAAPLTFRSERFELRIKLTDQPVLESVACRAAFGVAALSVVAHQLTERRVPFERLSGLAYTDRRLGLLDPGGNRIEIKQAWPFATV